MEKILCWRKPKRQENDRVTPYRGSLLGPLFGPACFEGYGQVPSRNWHLIDNGNGMLQQSNEVGAVRPSLEFMNPSRLCFHRGKLGRQTRHGAVDSELR